MEKKVTYKCFYCNRGYDNPEDVAICQNGHEKVIKKNNTETLNSYIKETLLDTSLISDGRYSFKELYDDKYALVLTMLALASERKDSEIWYTHKFSDGSSREGYILVGMNYAMDNQITYLLPEEMLRFVESFAKPLDLAPPFRGHNSHETNRRLYEYFIEPKLGE